MNNINDFIIICESMKIDTSSIELTSIPRQDEEYPVFILLTYTDTTMAKLIKFYTGDPYSHASVSFDPSLTDVYSFGRKFKDSAMTFINESIHEGIFKEVAEKDASYSLYVTFVTSEQLGLMKQRLQEFKDKQDYMKFSFRGLFNIARGKETHRNNEYFCSQFVAEILKAGDSKILNRDSSLYSPSDFRKIKNINFVCRGKLSNYDASIAKEKVNIIKMNSMKNFLEGANAYYPLTDDEVKNKKVVYNYNKDYDGKGVNISLRGMMQFLKDNNMQHIFKYYTIIPLKNFRFNVNILFDYKYDMVAVFTPFSFKVKNVYKIEY